MPILLINRDDNKVWVDITDRTAEVIPASFFGLCNIAILHTTAGIFVYEGKDPNSKEDLLKLLENIVPQYDWFEHAKQRSNDKWDSQNHIKSVLLGNSVNIPCRKGKMILGKWQRVFLCDFKTERVCKVILTLLPSIQDDVEIENYE